jgi:hypothetical protein
MPTHRQAARRVAENRRPDRQSGEWDYQLVIREIEVYDSDQDVAEILPIAVRGEVEERFVHGRVVYLDTIPIRL